ncbi:MAG TPA: acyl carrier protein [Actinocrinis sp.]|nr:acyl carrier protein [Actinocrinis sp.]
MSETGTAVQPVQVTAVVREVARLVCPLKGAVVAEASRLINDLGFHSLALVELGFNIEDLFGLEAVDPREAMGLSTVGDIVALVERALAEQNGRLPTVAEVSALCERYGAVWNPAA